MRSRLTVSESLHGVFFIAMLFAGPLSAVPYRGADLDGAQRQQMEHDGQLVFSEEVPGKAWPRITIFRTIPATADESFAVFSDVESEKEYIPGIRESKIDARLDPHTLLVRYVQNMPWPLRDENLIIRNTRERLPHALAVRWQVEKASTTRAGAGWAHFEPWGSACLLVYQTWMDPGFDIAKWPLVKKIAFNRASDVPRIIANRILLVRREQPTRLAQLVKSGLEAIGPP